MIRIDGRPDGRNARATQTRAALITTCRQLMVAGNKRPPLVKVARSAGYSIRSGFQHFVSVENLWRAALEEHGVAVAIVARVLGDRFVAGDDVGLDRIVRGIVFDADDAEHGVPLPWATFSVPVAMEKAA